jgi:ATP-independent RNA helicase DbpA
MWHDRERSRVDAIAARQQLSVTMATLPALSSTSAPLPPMVTLVLDGGKDDKLRPGDILGALTGAVGLEGVAIGKIDIHARRSYVAIRRDVVEQALAGLKVQRIKNKGFRVKRM